MQAAELIERAARAIRKTKYYTGGNLQRQSVPPSAADRRYATAAVVDILRNMAAMRLHLTPEGLEWWATELERNET